MKKLIFLLFILLTSFRCVTEAEDEEFVTLPTIELEALSDNSLLTHTSIELSANVTSSGSTEVISRGICWSTSPKPTIDDETITADSNAFSSKIESLQTNTTYYFRAYATSPEATVYSNQEHEYATLSFANSKWSVLFKHSEDNRTWWSADVDFYEDGTTMYDEPEFPGVFTSYGTWLIEENTLTYKVNAESTSSDYILIGEIVENTISGTYIMADKTREWSAEKYNN